MRSAGCTLNDWADRHFDRHVQRTKDRPLASGALTAEKAILFFVCQCLIGLLVLFQLPSACWIVGIISFILLLIYPFSKRVTYWPQVILGMAFNIGIWMGFLALSDMTLENFTSLSLLYLAGIFWTIAYDTIYALPDKKDDVKIGVKSTAIRFGSFAVPAVWACYGISFFCLFLFGHTTSAHPLYFYIVATTAFLTGLKLRSLDVTNDEHCLYLFRKNVWVGGLVFIALCCAHFGR